MPKKRQPGKVMGLFDRHFESIELYLEQMREAEKVSKFICQDNTRWPEAGDRDLILASETAVELGNPKDGSAAFLIWGNRPDKIEHGRTSVIGPDLSELDGQRIPFGKVVLIGGEDFDETNSYQRYRQLDSVRYDIRLKGYMMRGVSQYGREWSRVSRKAIDEGLSFAILGGMLIDRYMQLEFVRSVEIVFVTSGIQDMKPIFPTAESVLKITAAMNKMAEDESFDCDTCEFNDVCNDVEELRAMRKQIEKRKGEAA
jgi:CO dehydrogenase/acetyl-CoA synthase beta subunit